MTDRAPRPARPGPHNDAMEQDNTRASYHCQMVELLAASINATLHLIAEEDRIGYLDAMEDAAVEVRASLEWGAGIGMPAEKRDPFAAARLDDSLQELAYWQHTTPLPEESAVQRRYHALIGEGLADDMQCTPRELADCLHRYNETLEKLEGDRGAA